MQPPASAPSIPPPEEEPEELARFRAEWKAELLRRKDVPSGKNDTAAPAGSSTATNALHAREVDPIDGIKPSGSVPERRPQPGPSNQVIAGSPAAVTSNPATRTVYQSTTMSATLGSALNIYRRAVQHEQRGELDDALLLYRQAFRMDPHVDRAYHREEVLATIVAAQQAAGLNARRGEGANGIEQITEGIHSLDPTREASLVASTLVNILANFPRTLTFTPEVEGEPSFLQALPDEILVFVLRKLDHTSIERFAAVCRRARVVSLDSAIWRELVCGIYLPPQVPGIESMIPVVQRYDANYRQIYVEHPRVRLDGVYIAVCHYVRQGLSENSWVNISHFITYHRYLRFFPSGQVLSLLANEEQSPQQIIPLLKPGLRMKGLSLGTWYLSGTTIHLSNLIEVGTRVPHSTPAPGAHRLYALPPVENPARYAFGMLLSLRSRPTGKWNRLDIQSYDSVSLETGDVTPIALKHERPFWFSRVRSYAAWS
ncbi:hypothetical protein BD779DRAFT_1610373 [Infundibulicybe gibba]|nr:hypothetical protein BD779DRAFT_1610373 [Infundibulicybe gibba]